MKTYCESEFGPAQVDVIDADGAVLGGWQRRSLIFCGENKPSIRRTSTPEIL